MNGSVTVHMKAPAAKIWELVSDVTRIGEYSPETFEAEWLDGATGPKVGAHFRGHVKRNGRGPIYWTNCTVVRSVPDQEFAFEVNFKENKTNEWSYQIAPSGDGADVTESFTLPNTLPMRLYWALFGWARSKTNRDGMQTTLMRIKAEVERPK